MLWLAGWKEQPFLLEGVEVAAGCSWAASALSEVLPSVTCSLIIIPLFFSFFPSNPSVRQASLTLLITGRAPCSLLVSRRESGCWMMIAAAVRSGPVKSAGFTQALSRSPGEQSSHVISRMRQWSACSSNGAPVGHKESTPLNSQAPRCSSQALYGDLLGHICPPIPNIPRCF